MPSQPSPRRAPLSARRGGPPGAIVLTALLGASPAPAEPARAAHAHEPAAKPAAPARPVPPSPPPGPLNTPAALLPSNQKVLIEAIAHAGPRLVAVGVGGAILLSDDNGLSWRQVQPPVQVTLTGVWFADDNTGWVIGHNGAVLRTEDAGESWTLMLDATRAAQITLDAALAANGADTARHKATDAARRLADADPTRPFLLMQGDGADLLRVIGAGGMAMETEDAGRHWHAWSAGIDNPDGLALLGAAERDGLMVADGGRGILLAGRPEDGLSRLRSPTDATLFGALDAGRFGFLLFGQQGNAFAGTLAQPAVSTKLDSWHQVDSPTQNSFTAGLSRRDGSALLGDSAGMVWLLGGKPDDPRLEPAPARAPFPILAMTETADGALVLVGSGGLLRIEPPAPPAAPATQQAQPVDKAQVQPQTQPQNNTQAAGPAPTSPVPTAPSSHSKAEQPGGTAPPKPK